MIINKQITQFGRAKRNHIVWGGLIVCWVCLMLFTPKIPLSHSHHFFADMRNLLGVPNTLNVMTNFPFLVVGVVGFALSLQAGCFNTILRGEIWGWFLFYGGIVGVAFGSAYYHLKPDDSRVMLDTSPMMIAYTGLFSSFIVEKLGERIGLSCMFGLLLLILLDAVYTRMFNDLRLCVMFHLIPCVAIPGMHFLYPSQYTHSIYWLLAAGIGLLAKVEAALDKKIYKASSFCISGHSLEHLCSAAVPILLTVMLLCRRTRFQRLGDPKI